jgi:hypothetical protein
MVGAGGGLTSARADFCVSPWHTRESGPESQGLFNTCEHFVLERNHMRELSVMEVQEVSGAGLFSRLAASALAGVVGFAGGLIVGGKAGSGAGGILGVGALTAGVTMVIGGIVGPVVSAAAAFAADWDVTFTYVKKFFDSAIGGIYN